MNPKPKRNRFRYLLALAVVVAAGLLSRSGIASHIPSFMAAYAGDTLWALALYIAICLLFPTARTLTIAFLTIAISFAVEFSQIYQADWINAVRGTRIGALFLGVGFRWSDLPCYTAGCLMGVGLDALLSIGKRRRKRDDPPLKEALDIECTVRSDVPFGDLGEQLLDIYLPSTAGKHGQSLPVLMHFHGGAWKRGDKGMLAGASRWLAGQGFAVFTPNYRLVKRGRNRWPACWEDARLALEWTLDHAAKYGADPGRIGTVGYSAGAHLASLLATREETREHVKAVADFFGPMDLGPERRPVGQYILFGTRKPPRNIYEQASPALLASSGTPPFIIVHGCSDRLVPVEQAKVMHESLKRSGTESELCLFEGQPHAFIRPRRSGSLSQNAREAFEKVADFLVGHLMPGSDSDPISLQEDQKMSEDREE